MNQATRAGSALMLRNLLSESDIHTSAEALVLAPKSCLRIARAIVSSTNYTERTFNAAYEAVRIVEEALADGTLTIPDLELPWLDMIKGSLDEYHHLGATASAITPRSTPGNSNPPNTACSKFPNPGNRAHA